jgi:hypothetical protein
MPRTATPQYLRETSEQERLANARERVARDARNGLPPNEVHSAEDLAWAFAGHGAELEELEQQAAGSWRWPSERPSAAASSWRSGGATWSSSRAGCTCERRLFVAASRRPSRAPRGACSSLAHAPPAGSRSSGRRAATARTTRWCSVTRRSVPRWTRRSSPAATSAPRSGEPRSRSHSGPGTTSGIRRSRIRRRLATPRRTFRPRPGTRRAQSRSGTSTPRRSSSPAPRPVTRSACSAPLKVRNEPAHEEAGASERSDPGEEPYPPTSL